MDTLANLALGFETAMSLSNLLYCLIGVFLGTAVGVLPGIGPIATIAMLLPITFGLPPVSALIMLSGIYYGAQYGGSTTAILINLPGEFVVGGDGTRWLSDGAPGQGRPGTGDGRDRIFHRWKYCDSAGRAVCAAPGGCCASLRSCRVLLADGARPCRFDRAGEWLAAARTRHDRRRSGAGARRHRRQLGHLALQPWLPATGRWHRLCRHRHGYVRLGRNHRESRKRGDAHRAHQARDRIAAVPRGLAKNSRPDRTGHRAGLGAGHPAGRRCAARFICVLFAREEDLENAGAIRTGRHRRRGRP